MTYPWQPYLATVESAFPCVGEQEARDRAGLMLLRDLATQRAMTASWEAEQLLMGLIQIAQMHSLGALNGQALTDLRLACVRIWMAMDYLDTALADNTVEEEHD